MVKCHFKTVFPTVKLLTSLSFANLAPSLNNIFVLICFFTYRKIKSFHARVRRTGVLGQIPDLDSVCELDFEK